MKYILTIIIFCLLISNAYSQESNKIDPYIKNVELNNLKDDLNCIYSQKVTKDDIKNILIKSGLERIWLDLEPDLRNAISIDYILKNDSSINIGDSKFGGLPDLPIETIFPIYKDLPLSFVGQINFADIKKYDLKNLLPDKGLISFFFDPAQINQDGLGYKVIYTENTNNLVRKNIPITQPIKGESNIYKFIFKTGKLNFKNSYSAPYVEHQFFYEIKNKHKISDKEMFKYYDELNLNNYNSMLGYPIPSQDNSMEASCEIQRGNYPDSKGVFEKAALKWRNWILLLQVNCNQDLDMYLDDCGTLYFWIREDDLREKRFDKVILEFKS